VTVLLDHRGAAEPRTPPTRWQERPPTAAPPTPQPDLTSITRRECCLPAVTGTGHEAASYRTASRRRSRGVRITSDTRCLRRLRNSSLDRIVTWSRASPRGTGTHACRSATAMCCREPGRVECARVRPPTRRGLRQTERRSGVMPALASTIIALMSPAPPRGSVEAELVAPAVDVQRQRHQRIPAGRITWPRPLPRPDLACKAQLSQESHLHARRSEIGFPCNCPAVKGACVRQHRGARCHR